MKVILLNGSPNKEGCTYTALAEVAMQLKKNGVETEILQIGKKAIQGCTACGVCQSGNGCVFKEDLVNELLEELIHADGFIIGSPVYYASANGSLIAFLDRLFFAGNDLHFSHKLGASVVSARRAGTTAALEVLNKYFTIANMPLVSSSYWNMVHGHSPKDVRQDKEGLHTMRTLADNMAWLLKSIEAGRKAGIALPKPEPKEWTNFIR
ncbi:flavodoxin family protein [Lachnospiraceae bacterium ZAX-1]